MRLLVVLGLMGVTLVLVRGWRGDDALLAEASIAACRGDVDALLRLERQGLDVNEPFGGVTILSDAAGAGREASVWALVSMGADVNARGVGDMTALMRAALTGDDRTLTALLRAGADVNATNAFGYTPLMYAAMSGDVGRVRLLLGAGADPGVENHAGGTASDCAAENGHGDVARMLSSIEAGRCNAGT